MSRVRISLRTGHSHIVRGYQEDIVKQLEEGRSKSSLLVGLERDSIPTGQKLFVNPNDVVSVVGYD